MTSAPCPSLGLSLPFPDYFSPMQHIIGACVSCLHPSSSMGAFQGQGLCLYSWQSTFSLLSHLGLHNPMRGIIVECHTLPRPQIFRENRWNQVCVQHKFTGWLKKKQLGFNHVFWLQVQESFSSRRRLHGQWLDTWAVEFGQTKLKPASNTP